MRTLGIVKSLDQLHGLAQVAVLAGSAAELPSFTTDHTVTPSPLNPLGAKGVGESGTTGSLTAVHNAVVDALGHLGVEHVDLPLSPERVWAAIQAARPHPDLWARRRAMGTMIPIDGGAMLR